MKDKQKQYPALLNIIYRDMPYDYEAEMKQAAENGASELELKALALRGGRIAYDWGYNAYNAKSLRAVRPLKSGDLMKVFKTVTEGTVEWEGTVNYNRKRYHHGLQKRLPAEKWSGMFYRQLPARLERDGKVIFGALMPFCETGTEGVIWSVQEYGPGGYEGLNCLKDGDRLTVYKAVHDGEVEWEGRLDFGPEQVVKIGWSEVLRETHHMETKKWLQMTWDRRPVMITPQ